VGVHTPEFPFERDVDNVRRAAEAMAVEYPIALDPSYEVWRAFSNQYWPAAYIADGEGRIRHHHYGEGAYDEQEGVIQRLLGVEADLVSVDPAGFEAQADWSNLETPETYLGYEQAQTFASPGGASVDEARSYAYPDRLALNTWALAGDWTIGGRACVLNQGEGQLSFRFHARDVHLVIGPPERGTSVPFHVLVDGEVPGPDHGLDVDERGDGVVAEQRLHQLIRQQGRFDDRTFEITFLTPGVEAYAVTFG
jgi:hypothetical protein